MKKSGYTIEELSFDFIVANLCTILGWTWDYVTENVTLPMLASLGQYWGKHPPIHILAAAYLNYGGGETPKKLSPEEEKRQLVEDLSRVGKGKITLKNG